MSRRHLSPEERALWNRLTRTVNPLHPLRPWLRQEGPTEPVAVAIEQPIKGRTPEDRKKAVPSVPPKPSPVPVLDSSWERRIRSGRLVPDVSVDLHGLNLAAAHIRLDRVLAEAVVHGWRVLLIVTGKPRPAPEPGEPRRRGAIRAEIGDWLARSAHAHRIASVRQAHPRHGGDGALYIIMRRGGDAN